MNTAIGIILTGALIAGFGIYGANPPDRGSSPVGSEYCTWVRNGVDDTVGVFVIAPRTDSAIRPLGVLMPRDSGIAVLPYHISPLMLLYIQARGRGGWWQIVSPDSILPCRRVIPEQENKQ